MINNERANDGDELELRPGLKERLEMLALEKDPNFQAAAVIASEIREAVNASLNRQGSRVWFNEGFRDKIASNLFAALTLANGAGYTAAGDEVARLAALVEGAFSEGCTAGPERAEFEGSNQFGAAIEKAWFASEARGALLKILDARHARTPHAPKVGGGE